MHKRGANPFVLPAILPESRPSLIRPLQTIGHCPPDSNNWDDLDQRYLQLAALYGQSVVERAALVQAGRQK